MANISVVGSQWGDEGKGKVVDVYGESADLIVRYQGGNNAGHTIVVKGEKHILHLLPAAALHEGKECIIANGVVVDIDVLLSEIEELTKAGYLTTTKVYVSERAHVIMPYHKMLDKLREGAADQTTIGTTGRGIGPAYSDKVGRLGIRVGDLLHPEYLRKRLQGILPEKNCLLQSFYNERSLDLDQLVEQFIELGKRLKPHIANTGEIIHDALAKNKKIMFEGAQGVLLDIDHGTYPFVTSSNTISGCAMVGAGVPPQAVDEVIAITKAYTTRVGEGPFPTELENETGALIQRVGGEFGATTGRKRRCGWLDLVALRHAKRINGFTGIALTKLDVLSEVQEIKVCTSYELDGKKLEIPPSSAEDLDRVKPIYRTFPSWKGDLGAFNSLKEMPEQLQEYVKFIEGDLDTPVILMSVGPARDQTIVIRNPF